MPHYLVTATPKDGSLARLQDRIDSGEIAKLRPFGKALSNVLSDARRDDDGNAVWEHVDFGDPPLQAEREILDEYFSEIEVEEVEEMEGWHSIGAWPRLFKVRRPHV
ncbi:MAG: hypothetical protein AAGK04_11860 [Planctomycetota bacterium]